MTLKRIATIAIAVIFISLAITAASLYASPIGRRWEANQTANAPQANANNIDILYHDTLNHVFAPAVAQVKAGSTVTWHFKDIDEDGQPVQHNVVFEDEASAILATGTFSKTFAEPGTYEYTCTLHRYMDGVVVVTD